MTIFTHSIGSISSKSSSQDSIHTGGRLIERHLEYLATAGYKAVLSVVTFDTNDTSYNDVSGSFPSSAYQQSILESNDITMVYLASQLTVDDAYKISELIASLPKPLYIHCHVGWTASLFTLLHYYLDDTNALITSGEDIMSYGIKLGFDYQATQNSVDLINSVTNSNLSIADISIELTLNQTETSYKYYYWPHRLGNTDIWFNTGQFLSTHCEAIADAGYKSVMSFRRNFDPTIRLNSDNSSGSIDNYEFSDENGLYDIALEKEALEAYDIPLYYLPPPRDTSKDYTKDLFEFYLPILKAVEQEYPVLVHDSSGYRSAVYILTYIAYSNKFCRDWVTSQGMDIGFYFDNEEETSYPNESVMNFLLEVLQC